MKTGVGRGVVLRRPWPYVVAALFGIAILWAEAIAGDVFRVLFPGFASTSEQLAVLTSAGAILAVVPFALLTRLVLRRGTRDQAEP